MEKKYTDDSYALHTDLYQINMVQSYWQDQIQNKKAVFEIISENFLLTVDMRFLLDLKKSSIILRSFVFQNSDIDYLQNELHTMKNFWIIYRNLDFTDHPLHERRRARIRQMSRSLQVEAPLAEAQLIETALLNIVNYQTLIATKASRIKQVIGDEVCSGIRFKTGSRNGCGNLGSESRLYCRL